MKTTVLIGILLLATSGLNYKYDVRVAGAMRNIMQQGNLSARIDLDTLPAGRHWYGLGPAEGLKGEILVWDGKPMIGLVENGKIVTRQTNALKAAMLVYTEVDAWQSTPFKAPVSNLAELEKALETYARDRGIDLEKPFPFLLSGTAERLDYHVIDWRAGETHKPSNHKQFAQTGQWKNQPVEILGFYSNKHQGVFTHHTSRVHLHVANPERTVVAHVDDLALSDGVALKLPK